MKGYQYLLAVICWYGGILGMSAIACHYSFSRGRFTIMPYCPNCLTEYVKGTSECEDCKIQLLAGSPPEDESEADTGSEPGKAFGGWFRSLVGAGPEDENEEVKIVRIRTFSGGTASLDANLARNLLRARGVRSVLDGEASADMLPVLEVSLLVREDDADRAADILSNYFDKPGPILAE